MESNFDMAIRIGKLQDSSLIARRIGKTRSIVCASPEYWKTHGKPKSIQDLINHNCMRYSNLANPNIWNFTDKAGKHSSVKISGSLICNSSELEISLAIKGAGVCRMPQYICQPALESGELEAVLDDYTNDEIGFYAIYLPTRHVPAKIRTFIDYLIKHLPKTCD